MFKKKTTTAMIFALLLAVAGTGCGEKKGTDINAENSGLEEATINAENTGLDWQKTSTTTAVTETSTETTATEETTTTTTVTDTKETTEAENTPTTTPKTSSTGGGSNGGQKPKVNQITKVEYEAGMEFEYYYRFVPEEATVISDDINLGLITVDGKEFDITSLSNAYGEEEIQNIFGEQAGLYTTDRLIADGVFDDVYIVEKRSPHRDKFLFGENRGDESVEVSQEPYGLTKSKGAYDFINVEYVNGWFKGFHTKCLAMNNPTNNAIEQITVNGEVKPFVEENSSAQFTANNDKLITYTDKNIAVGDGTTLGDLTTIFGAEPTYVDDDLGSGVIYTYRNSTVTVGFVRGTAETKPELANKHGLSEEEQKSIPIVAVYMWLNE